MDGTLVPIFTYIPWMIINHSFCILFSVVCLDLTLNNGAIVYSGGSPDNRPEDVIAIHSCGASFSLVGEAVRTCRRIRTGEWSGSPPTCAGMFSYNCY